jgi:hypothetical protein
MQVRELLEKLSPTFTSFVPVLEAIMWASTRIVNSFQDPITLIRESYWQWGAILAWRKRQCSRLRLAYSAAPGRELSLPRLVGLRPYRKNG